jgi:hypothetical protein
MYRWSSRSIFPKFVASALTAIILSGGACYERPTKITSKGIKASEIVPSYWLRESSNSCETIFDKPRFNLKSNSDKNVDPIAPAKFTFKGKALVDEKPKTNKQMIDPDTFLISCQNGNAEFVFTDDRGGERKDILNLSKIELQLPKTPVDRSKDLKIPIVGAAYPQNMDIKTRVDSEIEDDGYDDMMMDTNDYKGDRTRITFDAKTQTLTIPARVLTRLKTKQPKITLEVNVRLYQEYPDKHSSPWFQYEYWTKKQPILLK